MSNNWHELNKRYLLAKIKELNENLTSYLDNCNFYGHDADDDQNLENSSIKHNKNESGKIINKKQENNNETKSSAHS